MAITAIPNKNSIRLSIIFLVNNCCIANNVPKLINGFSLRKDGVFLVNINPTITHFSDIKGMTDRTIEINDNLDCISRVINKLSYFFTILIIKMTF